MKVKTFKVRIKSLEQGLEEFKAAYRAAVEGRGKDFKPIRGRFFTSLEAARHVITDERMRLLQTVKKEKPDSIHELARLLGRDVKNVHQDVHLLRRLGLLTLGVSRARRLPGRPRVTYDRIDFSIPV